MGRVLHASGSGYFPECFFSTTKTGPKAIPNNVFSNTTALYPIGLSLENAMKLFWRLRKFNIRFLNYVIPIEMTSFTGNIFPQFARPPITDETEYVCFPKDTGPGTAPVHTQYFDENGFGIEFNNFRFSIFNSHSIAINPNDQEKLYYPRIFFSFAFREAFGLPIYYATTSQDFDSSFYPDINGGFYFPTGNFLDFFGMAQLPIFKRREFNVGFSVVFEATEYWSYEGLYDTTTGEPL